MRGDPPSVALGKRSAPVRFFCCKIQDGKHPRLIGQQSAAKLIWILSAGVSDFIQKRLHRKAGVRVSYGAPPLHRHFILWSVQIHLNIRNRVYDVRRAFHGCRVNPILDSETGEHGSVENRLTHNCVCPCHWIAAGIESRRKMVVPHRAIPTAAYVVFTSPHYFHRSFCHFGYMDGFGHEIGSGIGPAPKTAAEKSGVNLHLLGLEPCSGCSCGAITGLKLSAGPDFAMIFVQIYDGVEGLHHRMRKVRNFVLSRDRFRRSSQSSGRVANLASNRSWSLRHRCVLLAHPGGGNARTRALIPNYFEFLSSELRRPKTIGDDGHTGWNFQHIHNARNLFCFVRIEARNFPAENGRARNYCGNHPWDINVEPNCAVPLVFDGVSRRRVDFPMMVKSFGSFSVTSLGGSSFEAASARLPNDARRPL